jgi:hypothetical protein
MKECPRYDKLYQCSVCWSYSYKSGHAEHQETECEYKPKEEKPLTIEFTKFHEEDVMEVEIEGAEDHTLYPNEEQALAIIKGKRIVDLKLFCSRVVLTLEDEGEVTNNGS